MKYGVLTFQKAIEAPELLAKPVREYLDSHKELKDVWVAEIDPSLADTAAFCEKYDISPEVSANCVIVEAKRGEKVQYAACVILSTTRVDVNGVIRKALDARKASFAPRDTATSLAAMEYGGITPIGLPSDWPIFIDTRVMGREELVIGSGIRGSKIITPCEVLKALANARILDIVKE